MQIIHAVVHTMEGEVFPHGYVTMEQGKITDLGNMTPDFQPLPNAYDAGGGHLYPGLIDAHSHGGMWQESLGFEGDDGNEESDPCTPHLRAIDAIKLDGSFEQARRWGITTMVTGPGSANPIGGQMCALKTAGHWVDKMVVREPLAMKFALGENPKQTFRDKEQGPLTRMGIAAIIRENLMKAKKYLEQQQRAETDEDYDEPEYDAKLEALSKVLTGELAAHFHAHLREDIYTVLRICSGFHIKPVLVHGTGGWEIAQDLAEANIPVIVGPLLGTKTKPELTSMCWKSAGLLADAGVQVAICTDFPEVPMEGLLLTAYLAVQNGMNQQCAMESITKNPAQICGLWDRIGSIAKGKDGDLILFSQPPLSAAGIAPKAVWIDGKQVVE